MYYLDERISDSKYDKELVKKLVIDCLTIGDTEIVKIYFPDGRSTIVNVRKKEKQRDLDGER